MQKGHRVNQARGLISLGLFKDYDDIRNSPVQDFDGYKVMPGDIKYKDVNGDGKIDGNDQVAIGATTKPNLIYGEQIFQARHQLAVIQLPGIAGSRRRYTAAVRAHQLYIHILVQPGRVLQNTCSRP